MMGQLFNDRNEAAELLSKALGKYDTAKDGIVIGLPRGGVVLAALIAKNLHLPLDVICPRKVGFPSNKEFAMGAVSESGVFIPNQDTFET